MDSQVASTARQFGGSSPAFAALIQAMVTAEGGINHVLPAAKCSVEVTTLEEALDVFCRTAVHRLAEYVYAHTPQAFIDEFAQTWAPVGAHNDPDGLNANWPKNALAAWLHP